MDIIRKDLSKLLKGVNYGFVRAITLTDEF
jgi:hypothetical protein